MEVNGSQEKRKFQQSIKQLEDENKLLKSDLRRYKRRVDELESDVRVLSKELMVEQQKCKELDEAMVIRESEVSVAILYLHASRRKLWWNKGLLEVPRSIVLLTCFLRSSKPLTLR